MKHYRLKDLSTITGLTDRTLRNYLNQGVLQGEKINGVWCFTQEELNAFLGHPLVEQATANHRNAVVHDFLADTYKKENRICMILDYAVSPEEAENIAQFYGQTICDMGEDVEFRYVNERNLARVILSGAEDMVLDIVRKYYSI